MSKLYEEFLIFAMTMQILFYHNQYLTVYFK